MEFQIDPADPDQMIRKTGPGFSMLIWLLVLLAAIVALWASPGGPLSTGRTQQFAVAVAFIAVLALVVTRRLFSPQSIRLDRRRMVLVQRRGLLSGLSRREIPIGADAEVIITRELRSTQYKYYSTYPIRIRCNPADTVDMDEARDYDSARKTAGALADFVRIRITDSTEERTT